MQRGAWSWLVVAAAVAVAMAWSWHLRWSCDDAYISYRYAQHFVEGHGLVFNLDPAERPVEGYTNFTWTMLLALGMQLGFTGDAIETWAALLGTLCHGATVVVLALCARQLGAMLPVAAIGWALHHHAASLAPAGLETALFTLLVTLVAHRLIVARDARDHAMAGWLCLLAAMTRPDGAIVAVVAGAFALRATVRSGCRKHVLGFCLPFLLVFVPYLLWRLSYYGYPVPNTFYAKSGGDPYPSQGWVYVWEYLKCYWVLAVPLLALPVALLRRGSACAGAMPMHAPLVVIAALTIPYVAFVVWVGGDFMFSRFLLPVTPLLLLVLDCACRGGTRLQAVLLAVVVGAGMLFRTEPAWLSDYANPRGFSDNRAISVKEFAPGVPMTEALRLAGNYLRGVFEGLDVRIGIAGSHANLAYRSRAPVAIECAAGLTDAHIAHLPVPVRGMVGHERNYHGYHDYLRKRRVHVMFELSYADGTVVDAYRQLDFPVIPARLVTWDRALMAELKRRDPSIRFVDFEAELDAYLAKLDSTDKATVERDFAAFRAFYFDHNDDAPRRTRFEQWLASR